MESDGWAVQLENYKARVQQLEIELEQSVKREEQAAKLTSRLLEALNQISQEEDSNVTNDIFRSSSLQKSNSS
jgi:hypothetical protein